MELQSLFLPILLAFFVGFSSYGANTSLPEALEGTYECQLSQVTNTDRINSNALFNITEIKGSIFVHCVKISSNGDSVKDVFKQYFSINNSKKFFANKEEVKCGEECTEERVAFLCSGFNGENCHDFSEYQDKRTTAGFQFKFRDNELKACRIQSHDGTFTKLCWEIRFMKKIKMKNDWVF